MDVLITLFYLLFSVCVVYPPTEFVSAGFTICQIFEGYLGSENVNFVEYHMRRTALTLLIHALLPLGYVFCLWCGGQTGAWILAASTAALSVLIAVIVRLHTWWQGDKHEHPIARVLALYAPEGSDWKSVASSLNSEFRSVDKVSIPLTVTSKLVATESWLIKVCQYTVNFARQEDTALIATATDSHDMSLTGESEIQYVNIEAIPARSGVAKFSFRVTAPSLRELQPRLAQPVVVPDHLTLQPTLIERFVTVFKQHVDENPVYHINQAQELCIGCMVARADVKLVRRCDPAPGDQPNDPPCQQCNCRPLWCSACMARWWASRASAAGSESGEWLAARCTCPVCRAPFCLLDVCPVVRRRR